MMSVDTPEAYTDEEEILDIVFNAHAICGTLLERPLPAYLRHAVVELRSRTQKWVDFNTVH